MTTPVVPSSGSHVGRSWLGNGARGAPTVSHAATTALTFHLRRQHTAPHVEQLFHAAPTLFGVLATAKEAVAVLGSVCSRCTSRKALVTPLIAALMMLKYNPAGYSPSLARESCGVIIQAAYAISPTCFTEEILRSARATLESVPGLAHAVGGLLCSALHETNVSSCPRSVAPAQLATPARTQLQSGPFSPSNFLHPSPCDPGSQRIFNSQWSNSAAGPAAGPSLSQDQPQQFLFEFSQASCASSQQSQRLPLDQSQAPAAAGDLFPIFYARRSAG